MRTHKTHPRWSCARPEAQGSHALSFLREAPAESLERAESREREDNNVESERTIGAHSADIREGAANLLADSPESQNDNQEQGTSRLDTPPPRPSLPREGLTHPVAFGESKHRASRPLLHPRNVEHAVVPAGAGLAAVSSLGASGATPLVANPAWTTAGVVGGAGVLAGLGFREWAKSFDTKSKTYKGLKMAEYASNTTAYGAAAYGLNSALPAVGGLAASGLLLGYGLNRWADTHPPGSAWRNGIRLAGNSAYGATVAGLAYASPATLLTTAAAGAGAYGLYGTGKLADKFNEKLWGVKTGEHLARNYLGGQGFFRQIATAPVAAAAVPVGAWNRVSQWAHKVGWDHKPKTTTGKFLAGALGVPSAAVGIPVKRVAYDFIAKPTYNVVKGGLGRVGGFLKYAFSDQSKGSS